MSVIFEVSLVVRGALAADDALEKQGEELRFVLRAGMIILDRVTSRGGREI
jgi:hypothetical protein